MTRVFLALGSNLGDRAENLRSAVRMLEAQGIAVLATSSVWETPPVPADQPAFLNATLAAETELTPRELLATAKAIEWEMGRRPGRRWGPRPIDIDILLFGTERLEEADLVIPHPLMAERAFVLAPLAEISEDPLPVLGATAEALLAAVDSEGVVRTEFSLGG